jgi:hypothetical protein
VQSALSDGQPTLGDGHKLRLDSDPFSANVNLINFEEMKVLVLTSQADMTLGKNVVVSDERRARMMKPPSPEPGVWKINERKSHRRG